MSFQESLFDASSGHVREKQEEKTPSEKKDNRRNYEHPTQEGETVTKYLGTFPGRTQCCRKGLNWKASTAPAS